MPPRPSLQALLLAVLLTGACAPVGPFVWVDALPEPPPPAQQAVYLIAPGDLLGIRVWNQDSLSARVRVREDGKVSLLLLRDVQAAGLTPEAFAERLQAQLKDYLANPVVTVALEEARQLAVSVVGEVVRTGAQQLPTGAGVLQALAAAGGFTVYAKKDRIFVLRQEAGEPQPTRIRFTWEKLSHAEGRAATFRLRSGDVVVVE